MRRVRTTLSFGDRTADGGFGRLFVCLFFFASAVSCQHKMVHDDP